MFACSDAAQQAVIQEIREKKLDGIVVCSCSPKLHTATFRAMAERAGLNPYEYSQVNIREQCSWAHTHDRPGATEKALDLVRAGVAKTALSQPLERMRVETLPQALVLGAGVAGLRAAVALSDLGISVHLVEKAAAPGGQVVRWGGLFPNDKVGGELVQSLLADVGRRENIVTVLQQRAGREGGADRRIRRQGPHRNRGPHLPPGRSDRRRHRIRALHAEERGVRLRPRGCGDASRSSRNSSPPDRTASSIEGGEIRTIAYIYCVGSREASKEGAGHSYCSRYCCSATSHIATVVEPRWTRPSTSSTSSGTCGPTGSTRRSTSTRCARAPSSSGTARTDPPVVARGDGGLRS